MPDDLSRDTLLPRLAAIVGDRLYGTAREPAATRLMLHAARLAFPHPSDGRIIEVVAEPPDWFAGLS